MPGFALVGPSYEAANPLQDAQRCINWFPEIDKTGEAKAVVALLGSPGLVSVSTAFSGEVRGAWVLPGGSQALFVVGSAVVLMTSSFATTRVGTLNTSAGQVCIRDNGAGGIAVIVDGANGYVYNVAEKTTKQIIDPGWLGSDRVSFIDGWFVFNQPGTQKFYTSPVYWNGTAPLDATYFSLKDSSADNLVTHIENQRELWLIGERTSEVWYDVGGQYFPFSRLQGASLQIGCAAKHTVCRTGLGLIWLGKSERGENVVVMTQGYQFGQITTPAVAYAISQYARVDDAIAYMYTEEGHEFYVLTFPTADVTWVYDLNTSMWHQRARYDTTVGKLGRHRSNCLIDFAGKRLVGDYTNGTIWQMTRQAYSDGPDPLLAVRRTPHVWDKGERNRVRQSRLQIEFRPGVGLTSGQGFDPQVILRWSNDGGFTWSNEHLLGIGKLGEYTRRAIKRRLGAARDRVYEVSISDPVNRDIVGATLRGEVTSA